MQMSGACSRRLPPPSVEEELQTMEEDFHADYTELAEILNDGEWDPLGVDQCLEDRYCWSLDEYEPHDDYDLAMGYY